MCRSVGHVGRSRMERFQTTRDMRPDCQDDQVDVRDIGPEMEVEGGRSNEHAECKMGARLREPFGG